MCQAVCVQVRLVLSFYPAVPGYRTQVIKLSGKPPLSQLEGHFFNSIWNATCWERPTSTTLFEYFPFSLPLLSLCECYLSLPLLCLRHQLTSSMRTPVCLFNNLFPACRVVAGS